jgi:hypothetical protein
VLEDVAAEDRIEGGVGEGKAAEVRPHAHVRSREVEGDPAQTRCPTEEPVEGGTRGDVQEPERVAQEARLPLEEEGDQAVPLHGAAARARGVRARPDPAGPERAEPPSAARALDAAPSVPRGKVEAPGGRAEALRQERHGGSLEELPDHAASQSGKDERNRTSDS